MQLFSIGVVSLFLLSPVDAGVTFNGVIRLNSLDQEVYTVTCHSDIPVSTLGVYVTASPDSQLGQVHVIGNESPLQDLNRFFPFLGADIDHDTQVMFSTVDDSLLVVPDARDSDQELWVEITGFEPFLTHDIVQVVLIGDSFIMEIGTVAVEVETYWSPGLDFQWMDLRPEPASLSLLAAGSITIFRRRK